MSRIQPGSKVVMHFTISLRNGVEVMTSTEDEPLHLHLGKHELPNGLEMALWGLRAGEEQSIELTPEQAWGNHNPQSIHRLSRKDFPHQEPLQTGLILSFQMPDGNEIPGRIIEISDEEVSVDFNHPLAGQSIVFQAKIISVDNSELSDD